MIKPSLFECRSLDTQFKASLRSSVESDPLSAAVHTSASGNSDETIDASLEGGSDRTQGIPSGAVNLRRAIRTRIRRWFCDSGVESKEIGAESRGDNVCSAFLGGE